MQRLSLRLEAAAAAQQAAEMQQQGKAAVAAPQALAEVPVQQQTKEPAGLHAADAGVHAAVQRQILCLSTRTASPSEAADSSAPSPS